MNKEEKEIFCTYVNEKRQSKNLKMEQICEGLCDFRSISFWENGDRTIDSRVQEVILERLGVGAENQEIYLDYSEYDCWEERHNILHRIMYEEFDEALHLLENYKEKHGIENSLEKQFYLSMLAQIRRCQGASEQELTGLFREALLLTVPYYDSKLLCELVLSIKELNLILEIEKYREEGTSRYLEIIEYIEKNKFDNVGEAKIFPKVIYYMYIYNRKCKVPIVSEKEMLRYCNEALECLRDTYRTYYLWEILQMRQDLLSQKKKNYLSQHQMSKVEELSPILQQNAEWLGTIETVYEDFGVPKETFDYCYLYVQKGVSCIADVIYIRRNMLGMTMRGLGKGFCDARTVKRLERRQTCPQRAVVRELFIRLGLSKEYIKTRVVTEKQDAKTLMEEINDDINSLRWEEAEKKIPAIRKLLSLDDKVNLQAVLKMELNALRGQKKISAEEYNERLKKALELTIPFRTFLKEGRKYLTHMELLCIHNMVEYMDKKSEEYQLCLTRMEEYFQFYIDRNLQETVSGLFGTIMGYVASERANQGELERADKYNDLIIEGCLRYRRLLVLPSALYDRQWNYTAKSKQGIPVEKELNAGEEIKKCAILSNLAKQERREKFYRDKLKNLEES